MSSSQSPDQQGEADPPTSFNLNILRNISDKRTTRDGDAPKRRGPKPDSRPALTRRQELNRQAQRTHRERKELYIKALEDEVLRLKEVFSSISQDKERLAEENRQLKSLLAQGAGGGGGSSSSRGGGGGGGGGGSGGGGGGGGGSGRDTYSTGGSQPPGPGSSTGAYTTPTSFSTPSQRGGLASPPQHGYAHAPGGDSKAPDGLRKGAGLDYDQAGIDFVLTLEKPCMSHLPILLEHGATAPDSPSGHALMACCPPQPFAALTEDVPFGTAHVAAGPVGAASQTAAPAAPPAPCTWEPAKGDLTTLLALSAQLGLDGEITPVMAWRMVLAHPRLCELTEADLRKLADELVCKSRCYGFGAVMEEFEVRDALANVFSTKACPVSPAMQPGLALAF